MIFPRAFNIMSIIKAARKTGLDPFNPRLIIESSGQWSRLSQEQQRSVLAAYPKCVDLYVEKGYVTEEELEEMNIPWGTLEKKEKRHELSLHRWRATHLTSPEVLRVRAQRIQNRIQEEREKEQKRQENERKKAEQRALAGEKAQKRLQDEKVRLEKSKEIWRDYVAAGFLQHRSVLEVSKKTKGITKVPDLIGVLKYLNYDGSTTAEEGSTQRPTLVKILEGLEIPAEFLSSVDS